MYDMLQQRTMELMNHKNNIVVNKLEELSVRDLFAAACLAGLQANSAPSVLNRDPEWIADYCYRMSDAMLKRKEDKNA